MSGRVILAGGSGFIGRHLTSALKDRGFDVVMLTRKIGHGIPWDGHTYGAWAEELESAFAVINLSGSPISTRWTPDSRREILHSRVDSTKVIGEAISRAGIPPKYWINGSATGYYGSQGDTELAESAPCGRDFLSRVCDQWESAVWSAYVPKTHKTVVRTGFVLGSDGGALPILRKLTSAFLGGKVGDGRQWMPWIHIEDLVGMIIWALQDNMPSVLNGCSPNPVTNGEFMRELRKSLHRPWSPPAPDFAIRFIEKATKFPAPELLLGSWRAIPAAALKSGFEFEHADLRTSLSELV